MKEKWRALVAEDRPFRERAGLLVAGCGLLTFTLFVFAPISIYLDNTNEFWFQLSQFWWVMAVVGLAVFAVLFGVGLLLKGKLFNLYVTLLFSLAVVLYLQGNFLNISYGELNGQQVDWSRYGGHAILNFALVAVLFFIPYLVLYFTNGGWKRMVRFVSFLIVAVQVVTMVSLLITNNRPQTTEMALGWAGVSNYSKEQNLVLIVVDAFDEPYFTQYTSENPEAVELFDGFTYFPNTSGTSMTTFFSMVPMLTGHVFDYDPANYDAFLDEAWNDATMFQKLKTNNYDVRLLSAQEVYIGAVRDELFDNYILGNRGIIDYKKFTRLMMELVLYTYMPHVFKAGFWMYPGEFNYLQDKVFYTDDDTEAYRHITESPVSASSKQKTFRLYHLNALHEPFDLTADAKRAPNGGETSAMEQAAGTFLILETLLGQMQEAGVYDNTTIIITADHCNSAHVDSESLTSPLYSPVLMVKPQGARGAMATSNAPASLFDIRATFLAEAGMPYDEEGLSLLELTEGQERQRYFYRAIGSPRTFYEYVIGSSDANVFSNYTATGAVFAPPGGMKIAPGPANDD